MSCKTVLALLAARAARFQWEPYDPEIVSDALFAIANVISFARTTWLMPAFEVLGPLQISLGRMIGDITRFMVLFTLVSPAHPSPFFFSITFLKPHLDFFLSFFLLLVLNYPHLFLPNFVFLSFLFFIFIFHIFCNQRS